MTEVFAWFNANWFPFLQTVCAIGGLCFTAGYFVGDGKSRRVVNLSSRTERHRALWDEARRSSDLYRIFHEDANVLSQSVTVAEEEFLNAAFLHFEYGWELAEITNKSRLNLLRKDVQHFFSLPLPRAVWEKTKQYRNPKFVRFVDRALEAGGRLRPAGA